MTCSKFCHHRWWFFLLVFFSFTRGVRCFGRSDFYGWSPIRTKSYHPQGSGTPLLNKHLQEPPKKTQGRNSGGNPIFVAPKKWGGNLEFLIAIPSVESIGMRSTARCYTTWLILNNWSKKSERQFQWQSERWFQIIATCPSCVIPIRDILYNDITYII